MSGTTNKAVIRRWIEEGWNAGNLAVVDELYTSDFFARSMEEGVPDLEGRDAVREMVTRLCSAFPDLHFRIDQLVAEGDMVVGAFTLTGTHRGPLQGIPPTGRRVTFSAVDIWQFKEGRIVKREVGIADVYSMLRQLGLDLAPKV